jgi:hypothetical protein
MAWQLAAHAAGVAAAQASWQCQPCQPMELSSQLQEQSSQQLSQACQLPQQLVMQFQDDLQLLREQAASSLQIHAQAVDAMLQAVAAAAGAEQHFSTAVAAAQEAAQASEEASWEADAAKVPVRWLRSTAGSEQQLREAAAHAYAKADRLALIAQVKSETAASAEVAAAQARAAAEAAFANVRLLQEQLQQQVWQGTATTPLEMLLWCCAPAQQTTEEQVAHAQYSAAVIGELQAAQPLGIWQHYSDKANHVLSDISVIDSYQAAAATTAAELCAAMDVALAQLLTHHLPIPSGWRAQTSNTAKRNQDSMRSWQQWVCQTRFTVNGLTQLLSSTLYRQHVSEELFAVIGPSPLSSRRADVHSSPGMHCKQCGMALSSTWMYVVHECPTVNKGASVGCHLTYEQLQWVTTLPRRTQGVGEQRQVHGSSNSSGGGSSNDGGSSSGDGGSSSGHDSSCGSCSSSGHDSGCGICSSSRHGSGGSCRCGRSHQEGSSSRTEGPDQCQDERSCRSSSPEGDEQCSSQGDAVVGGIQCPLCDQHVAERSDHTCTGATAKQLIVCALPCVWVE